MPKYTSIFCALLIVGMSSLATAQVAAVGSMAPKFTAKNQYNKDVAFPPKGEWAVLAFYPRAGTPG